MAETTTIGATGIQTGPNELVLPTAALVKAQNCVISGQNVITSRRGQTTYGYTHSGLEKEGFFYGSTPFVIAAGSFASTLNAHYSTGSGFSSVPPLDFYAPDASMLRVKHAKMRDQLFLTTGLGGALAGVLVVDSMLPAPVFRMSGVPNGPARVTSTVLVNNGGFLSASSSVAYRIVFGAQTTSNLDLLGRPSGRVLVTNGNASNTYNVTLTFSTDPYTTSGYNTQPFWQIYRSKIVASTATPSDEMFLVAEGFTTPAQIAAGEITFTDSTPEAFLSYPLYTNANGGEGLAQGNAQPPLSKDMASWGDEMWYANTRQPQSALLSLLGAGSGIDGKTGMRLGDQIRFLGTDGSADLTYTAWGSDDTVNRRFTLTTSGTPSANVRSTAISLASMIERDYVQFRPEYLSADTDPTGNLRISTPPTYESPYYSAFRVFLRTYNFPIAIGALTRAGATVTATTTDPHGLATNDTVYVSPSGAADPNYAAGTFTVTVTGANTFTYGQAGTGVASLTAYQERRITPVPQYAWNPPPSLNNVAIGGLSRTGTTVTVTTGVAHGASVGDTVAVLADSAPDVNFAEGNKVIVSVPTATTFTYTEAGAATTSTTVYGAVGMILSDADVKSNGLYYSKVGQPEAVPFPNYLEVGPAGTVLKRIVALDSVLTAWTDNGLYAVTGSGPYKVELVDPTVKILAADTAAAVDGRVYALTNKGVVATNGVSVDIVSLPIKDELDTYLATGMIETTKVAAYGASKETDRQYLLLMPANSLASSAPYNAARIYVYSTQYNGWTTWETPRYWARVNPTTDVLYSGLLSSNTYTTENGTRLRSDFADGSVTLTGVSFNTTTKVLTCASTASLAVGDLVLNAATYGAASTGAVVVSIDSATTATLSGNFGTIASTVLAYSSFPVEMEWRASVAPSAADWKHWRELHMHFRTKDFYKGTVGFRTDWNETQTEESSPLITDPYTWVAANPQLVGLPSLPKQSRIVIPTNSQRASYIRVAWEIREAFALWGVNGLSLVYEGGSERGQR